MSLRTIASLRRFKKRRRSRRMERIRTKGRFRIRIRGVGIKRKLSTGTILFQTSQAVSQTILVPPGVTSIIATVMSPGAPGGYSRAGSMGGVGGAGGSYRRCSIATTAGQPIIINFNEAVFQYGDPQTTSTVDYINSSQRITFTTPNTESPLSTSIVGWSSIEAATGTPGDTTSPSNPGRPGGPGAAATLFPGGAGGAGATSSNPSSNTSGQPGRFPGGGGGGVFFGGSIYGRGSPGFVRIEVG